MPARLNGTITPTPRTLVKGSNDRPVVAPWSRQGLWDFLRGPIPTLASRAIVGIILLLAGYSKQLRINDFVYEIRAYQMVPNAFVHPMANILPPLEMLVGAFLILGLWTKWTAVVAGALFVIFEIAIISALMRHLNIQCGCFGNVGALGSLQETISPRKVVEDLFYLALCVHLFFIPTRWSIDDLRTRGTQAKANRR